MKIKTLMKKNGHLENSISSKKEAVYAACDLAGPDLSGSDLSELAMFIWDGTLYRPQDKTEIEDRFALNTRSGWKKQNTSVAAPKKRSKKEVATTPSEIMFVAGNLPILRELADKAGTMAGFNGILDDVQEIVDVVQKAA